MPQALVTLPTLSPPVRRSTSSLLAAREAQNVAVVAPTSRRYRATISRSIRETAVVEFDASETDDRWALAESLMDSIPDEAWVRQRSGDVYIDTMEDVAASSETALRAARRSVATTSRRLATRSLDGLPDPETIETVEEADAALAAAESRREAATQAHADLMAQIDPLNEADAAGTISDEDGALLDELHLQAQAATDLIWELTSYMTDVVVRIDELGGDAADAETASAQGRARAARRRRVSRLATRDREKWPDPAAIETLDQLRRVMDNFYQAWELAKIVASDTEAEIEKLQAEISASGEEPTAELSQALADMQDRLRDQLAYIDELHAYLSELADRDDELEALESDY